MGASRPLTDRSADLQRLDQGPLARTCDTRSAIYDQAIAKQIDIGAVERAARARTDARIEAVKALAVARQNTLDKQADAATAEREDTIAWIAAIRQGWTEDELKDSGFDPPKRRGPGRPRRRRAATAGSPSTNANDSGESSRGPDTAHVGTTIKDTRRAGAHAD